MSKQFHNSFIFLTLWDGSGGGGGGSFKKKKGQIFLFRKCQFAAVPLVYKATSPLQFSNSDVRRNNFSRKKNFKRQLMKCWCSK